MAHILRDIHISTDLDDLFQGKVKDGVAIADNFATTGNSQIVSADTDISNLIQNSIVVGNSNQLSSGKPQENTLICGKDNEMYGGINNALVLGKENIISGNQSCAVIGGQKLSVDGNCYNCVLAGSKNIIHEGTAQNSIYAGQQNEISSNSSESIVCGTANKVRSQNSLVQGMHNEVVQTLSSTTASMNFVLGKNNKAIFSRVGDRQSQCAYVFGDQAQTFNGYTFVMNLTYPLREGQKGGPEYYTSHGVGTVNFNMPNGLKDFYIGDANFIECILAAVSQMTPEQKRQLKAALS